MRTFEECYKLWRAQRIRFAEAGIIELATVHIDDLTYESNYRTLAKQDVTRITTPQLNDFLVECISRYNRSHTWRMTKKCFESVKRLGKSVFRFAYENRLIDEDPFDRVRSDIAKTLPCRTNRKSDKEQVLTRQECTEISGRLKELHRKRPEDVRPLAIMLYMHIGARLGEPLALTWNDCTERFIKIRNSVCYQYEIKKDGTIGRSGEKLKGSTKTGKGRVIPITPEIRYILDEVKTAQRMNRMVDPNYVFSDASGVKTERSISQYFSKRICKPLGISGKAITALRKTAASRMAQLTPDRNMIAQLLGHSVYVDEAYYQFDLTDTEQKIALLMGR